MADRDVRLTVSEIVALEDAARREMRRLRRSIVTAEASRAAGNKIQEGTLDRAYRRLGELGTARTALEVARDQIARRMADELLAGGRS